MANDQISALPSVWRIPVRIVLVEPAGARNVGSIARVMKNMGLWQLVLVNPQCDPLSAEARHMAVHAADLLETAVVVADLGLALQGCQRVIATIGRDTAQEVEPLRSVIPWLLGQDRSVRGLALPTDAMSPNVDPPSLDSPSLDPPWQAAIVFGREDHGLNNAEIQQAQRLVTIPSSPDYASLNLAQAVGICCYEIWQAIATAPDTSLVTPLRTLLPLPDSLSQAANPLALAEDLEVFYEQLEQIFLQIGYLYPHTAFSRMRKFRAILNRAQPSAAELKMLRGILRQVHWALSQVPQQIPDEPASNTQNLSKFSFNPDK
ncbi:MAG: RNA methyltransferase [Synechococcales bacterium]|nr:RNA methyltransferase [Synechococcales bacterium]